jgi:inhibitor of the pro-sigma K processing machinery
LVALCGVVVKLLLKIGKTSLRIILNMLIGFISLYIVNILPFIHIPINWITTIIAGFGGIIGVSFLILIQLLGFI